jgi:hypothetical protein
LVTSRIFRWVIIFTCSCFVFACQNKYSAIKEAGIIDLLPISNDTLIAVSSDSKILTTNDGGANWVIVNNSISNNIKQITIDQNRVLWGLDFWHGIHEPSYSELFFSSDFGRTWQKIGLDYSMALPVQIISLPFSQLTIEDVERKQYQLSHSKTNMKWEYVGKTQAVNYYYRDTLYTFSEGGYITKANRSIAGDIDTLKKIDNISKIFQVIKLGDTFYIAGSAEGGYNSYFASFNVRTHLLHRFLTKGDQILGIRKGRLEKMWIFGDAGIFLKKEDSLVELLAKPKI